MEREQYALDAARVLTPHVLLPVQVDQPAATWLQRLCLAIFEDALKCLKGRQRDRDKAWEWILLESEVGLSFRNVCWMLNFNAGAVRRQLQQGGASQRQIMRIVRSRKSAHP